MSTEHHERASAGDYVIDSEIDAAIANLQGMPLSDKACEVHAASTILILRINKQLLRGQSNATAAIALLRGTVEHQERRLTNLESRALQGEDGIGMVKPLMKQAGGSSPWMWGALTVISIVVTVWKALGWL